MTETTHHEPESVTTLDQAIAEINWLTWSEGWDANPTNDDLLNTAYAIIEHAGEYGTRTIEAAKIIIANAVALVKPTSNQESRESREQDEARRDIQLDRDYGNE